MRKLVFLILVFFQLVACTKEVGKEPYELVFQFETQEQILFECLIYEKQKKYVGADGSNIHKGDDSIIILKTLSKIQDDFQLDLFKTKADYLICINKIYGWRISTASFASNQDVNLLGVIEMNGSYKKKGKKFIVENGTFTINWSNAPDYGEPVQELTGTWSLKRK